MIAKILAVFSMICFIGTIWVPDYYYQFGQTAILCLIFALFANAFEASKD